MVVSVCVEVVVGRGAVARTFEPRDRRRRGDGGVGVDGRVDGIINNGWGRLGGRV